LPQRKFDLDKGQVHLRRQALSARPCRRSTPLPTANGSVEMAQLMQQTAAKIGVNLTVNRVPRTVTGRTTG